MFMIRFCRDRARKFKATPKAILLTALACAALAGAAVFAVSASAGANKSAARRDKSPAVFTENLYGPALNAAQKKKKTPPPPVPLVAQTFSNSTPIVFSTGASPQVAAAPYPSTINVTGMSGTITDVNVTLNNITHSDPDDIDILLVAPNGDEFMIMSDAGGTPDASNITLTFDDAAASTLPDFGGLASGTFKPTDYDGAGATEDAAFPGPAPAAPYFEPAPHGTDTFASVFNGDTANGNWSLYVIDDANGQASSQIAGGWSITIDTASAAQATTTTVSGSPNPAFTNQNITITANVTSGATVNEGTVNFKRGSAGGPDLSCTGGQPRPVSSGTATCTVAASSIGEGTHTIFAVYNGTANFSTSNGSYSQEINTPTTVTGNEFCNTGDITIPTTVNAASPYPSNIFVSGLSGSISKVTVDINGLTHADPDDIDILLVGPGGQNIVLMSDAGGLTDISNVNLVFDDAAAGPPSDGGPLTSGTYDPVNYAPADTFPAPAPAPSGSTTLSVFNGTNPNGTWKLYVFDDASPGGGTISEWCVTFTTTGDAPTTTTLTSSPNPSLTTDAVVFTATVVQTSNSNPVTVGTVNFREGATPLTCTEGAQPRPLNGSGQATCTVAAGSLSEGDHLVSADYNGSAGQFNTSTDDHTHIVNSPTVVTGNEFCNNGVIAIPAPSPSPAPAPAKARPYPSNIVVSGLSGTISKVTVEINDLTHTNPDDVDLLLVGPGGQNVLLMSDAGGTGDVSNVDLVFDDAGGGPPPDAGPLVSGTYTVSNHAAPDSDAFPSPAPSGPYGSSLSVFNTTTPNGTWQLYVIDDAGSEVGQIGGWCLNFTLFVPVNISIHDATVDEPTSGSTNAVFTVVLDAAPVSNVTVNFQTADGTAKDGIGEAQQDYTNTNGTLTFTAGQTVQTISVPVLADADNAEGSENFFVNLSGATNATISDNQATGTILPPGSTPGASVMISELRTSGPGGSADEFVELYNVTDSPIDITGWSIARKGATCTDTPVVVWTVPASTSIPGRGHYLVAGAAYSLGAYATGDNGSAIADIPNDSNVGLFSTSSVANYSTATRVDAVGFHLNIGNNCDLLREGSPLAGALGDTDDHSYVRLMLTGRSQDTNTNTADFIVVTTFLPAEVGNNPFPFLGAPGPENLASPRMKSASTEIMSRYIDMSQCPTCPPNRVRDTSSYQDTLTPSSPTGSGEPYALGTLAITRRFINTTGQPVTRLRFRIINITTRNSPNAFGGAQQADLRFINSNLSRGPLSVPAGVSLQPLTLEDQASVQLMGGGWNSSGLAGTITTGSPLPATDDPSTPNVVENSIDIQFLLGVAASGKFNFFFIVEALP